MIDHVNIFFAFIETFNCIFVSSWKYFPNFSKVRFQFSFVPYRTHWIHTLSLSVPAYFFESKIQGLLIQRINFFPLQYNWGSTNNAFHFFNLFYSKSLFSSRFFFFFFNFTIPYKLERHNYRPAVISKRKFLDCL